MSDLTATGKRWLSALSLSLVVAATAALLPGSPFCQPAEARHRHATRSHSDSTGGGSSGRHHLRHHSKSSSRHGHKLSVKPRYAYPPELFMMHAPDFDKTMLPPEVAERVKGCFESGTADSYAPNFLVRAGVVQYYPLRGGIFERREKVKYIIVHSTETGVPQDARRVIDSWSSGGRRHPGAQFVVDRDGTIYEAVDPELATVHVNIFKTLPGINNDDSVGIEMVHAGAQTYTPEQKLSVTRLVSYLQDRFHVSGENIVTHRYAQQGDHTDPVAFDWDGFLASEDSFHNKALALRGSMPKPQFADYDNVPTASVYLEMHKSLRPEEVAARRLLTPKEVAAIQSQLEAAQAQASAAAYNVNYLDVGYRQPDVLPDNAGARKALPIRGEIELPPGMAGAD